MLEIEQLTFRHSSGFTLCVPHLQIAPGEVRAVLGTNGAGKSTLLRLMSAEQPSRGQVALHGRPLECWRPTERARHLGVLPQASNLDFAFTAREVVALGLTPLSLGWRDAGRVVREVMRATDCEHLATNSYIALSGGERQRVHLARVLLQLSQAELPPVLLLDEPTSAQDLGQQHRVLQLACDLARERGYAVGAILHDLNLALRYANYCTLLHAGRVVTSGAPAEVISGDNIERYWGYTPTLLTAACGRTVVA